MPRLSALVLPALVALVLVGCGDDADAASTPTTEAAATSSSVEPDEGEGTAPPSSAPADDGGIVLEEDYTGDGPTVAVLGDSLTVQGYEDLRSDLPDNAVRVAAVRGEGFASGAYSRAFGRELMREAAADMGATEPDVAVIALGTNDAWSPDGTLPDALAALDTIVADLGDACLVTVLVDAGAPADDFDADVAAQINARLEQIADEVVDWGDIAAEDGVLSDDGIHPTEEGAEVWAGAVADAVVACTPAG